MSKLTFWLERMGALLILSTKWADFWTYDEDLTARELMIKLSNILKIQLQIFIWYNYTVIGKLIKKIILFVI